MYTLAEVPVKVFEFAQSVYELYKVTCKLLLYIIMYLNYLRPKLMKLLNLFSDVVKLIKV